MYTPLRNILQVHYIRSQGSAYVILPRDHQLHIRTVVSLHVECRTVSWLIEHYGYL